MKENLISSMNESLYDDFFINELETRLETDPLSVGSLFSLGEGLDTQVYSSCTGVVECGSNYYSCSWD